MSGYERLNPGPGEVIDMEEFLLQLKQKFAKPAVPPSKPPVLPPTAGMLDTGGPSILFNGVYRAEATLKDPLDFCVVMPANGTVPEMKFPEQNLRVALEEAMEHGKAEVLALPVRGGNARQDSMVLSSVHIQAALDYLDMKAPFPRPFKPKEGSDIGLDSGPGGVQ